MNFSKGISRRMKTIVLSIIAAVLVISVSLGIAYPFLFSASQAAQIKQTNAERYESASSVDYYKQETVNMQVGAEKTLDGLLVYNPDGTVMPAANNHIHFQMAYDYSPYTADGQASSDKIYTYNYVFDQQTFGAGMLESENTVMYPSDNPMFKITYIPPTVNGVTFGLKITVLKLPATGAGAYQFRYFAHAGNYDANDNCGYVAHHTADCSDESHGLFDSKYTQFNCNFGLYEIPATIKRQVLNLNVTSPTAAVLKTDGVDGNGYIAYSSNGYTQSQYSISQDEADNGIIINPSVFAKRTNDGAIYSFNADATLSSNISKIYTRDMRDEVIDTAEFNIADYFNISYVPYVKDLKSDLLLDDSLTVSVPSVSGDATLLTTGSAANPLFTKDALALKFTKKDGVNIEPLYGRTLFFETKIKKLASTAGDTTLKFKFKIVNEIAQNTASYGDLTTDIKTYDLVTDVPLEIGVDELMMGTSGKDDRFTILPFSGERPIGFCTKENLADGTTSCDGSFDLTHGHSVQDKDLINVVDFTTSIEGTATRVTRLDESENKLYIKKKDNFPYQGEMFVVVKVWDVRTNAEYNTCIRIRVIDEGATAKNTTDISTTLRGKTKEVPGVTASGEEDTVNTKTSKPINAVTYDNMLNSGVRYAQISFDITNYASHLIANNIITAGNLRSYGGATQDHPIIKYGLKITPEDIYKITQPVGHTGDPVNIGKFHIDESSLDKVFYMDNSIYQKHTNNKQLESEEAYMAWMIDSVDRNLYILPLKSTKYMSTLQKDIGMDCIPFGMGAEAQDIQLKILKKGETELTGSGRWLKFNFTIDNVMPERSSIADVSTLLQNTLGSDVTSTADPDYFPANTIKLISSNDGYNKYKKGVANNNLYNLPQTFILDVYDYINDADVYRFENKGVPKDSEEKAGYDRLRFDITNINSQIPGFQSTSYGNKIEVLGSNDGKNWYTYSQLTSAAVNMTKVRYLKFTGKQNIKFITTVVVVDQSNRTTSGKFTIDVIDSKPVYEVDGSGLDGFVHEIIKDGAEATDLYRDVVHQNFLTLRTFPLDTTGTSYISSYTQWVNPNGDGTGLNDYSKVLNKFTNKASLVVNKFVKDPDGEAIKFGTNEDPTTNRRGIPLRIAASDINKAGTDPDVLVVYALQAGTTAFYEAEIVDSKGTKIFSIRLNLNSDTIEVVALSSYSTAIQVYFPVVSEVDMTDFDGDINSYYCFNLKLLNSKPQVDESKMVGSYVGDDSFKFGNGTTFNAGSSINNYVTDVDKADYDSKQLYIMTAASGRNGGYEDNIQVGVEVMKDGATVIEWLNISKVEDSVNLIKFEGNKLQFVSEGETLTTGLSVIFTEADGLTVTVKGAVRNKLYVRFYVANFDCNSVTQFLSGNREYSTTQVTYSYTVSGGSVTSALDTIENNVITSSKRINLLQPINNSVNKAPDTYYIINEDKTDDGINDVGYVKIPIADIANSSSTKGFFFAGHKANNVSYTQLYRNLISSTGANQYLSSNGSEDTGYYVKHADGTVSTSLSGDNLPAIVFVVDEKDSKHELWLRPSSRTSDEGFQLRLRLSDAISAEGKAENNDGEYTYARDYSDVSFYFKVQNFEYGIAYNKENTDGTSATFNYQHPTFNLQHTGIEFSMRMGSESDKQLKLYYDTNADADPSNTTEPHARMEATIYSKTLGGTAADVKDYYYIRGTSTTEFIVEGMEAMGKPKVNYCTDCGKVVGTGTENTCLTHGVEKIEAYYPSVKIIPKQVTGGPKTVTLVVMDFMGSGTNSTSIYSGKKWNINLQLHCVDAPEIVNPSAMYPGSKTMTLMDMSGQRVYLTDNTDSATVTTPCDRSGDLTYCNPEGKDYVFCDGLSHYKKINFVKDDFNTSPGEEIHLSDIFNDSDIVKVCKNGKTHADAASSCDFDCGYVSKDSLIYFPTASAQIKLSLKTLSGEDIVGADIASFEPIKLGETRTWSLGVAGGKEKVVEITLDAEQRLSIKLLSRSGIEKYDSEGGIRLGINFKQETNAADGVAYNILLQTADNPMIIRQKDLDITVGYQSAGGEYSTKVPVNWIAYDFNAGDIPTFNTRLSDDDTLNPLIDVSYQSAASDGTNGVKIRRYIELGANNSSSGNLSELSFKVLRLHSDSYAKTDVYGNNVYACKPEVQIYRKTANDVMVPYEGDIRKPKEMRTIRFRVDKNPISVNNSMDSALKYSPLDNNGLTSLSTGKSFSIYSSPRVALPDPVYSNIQGNNGYNLVNISKAYETTLNKNTTDNKILAGFVVANLSDAGDQLREMIYFKKEFQVFLVNATDSDPTNWTQNEVTSDGYVTISFNQNAFWVNGDQASDTGELQGDVKMTITAKKPIIQNADGKLFLRLRVGAQDLYGQTVYKDIDFRTTNSAVTANKDHQYYNKNDSANGIYTFNTELKNAADAWGSNRPSNEGDILPDGLFDQLSISNMFSDRDMGRFYVGGQAATTYNTYRVKMSINGTTKYLIPEDRTPSEVTEPDGSKIKEINTVYLLKQGSDDRTVISDVYDKTADTRHAVIKIDESGRFKIYPIRSTVGISDADRRFNFEVVEYEQKRNEDGALVYVKSTSSELKCRINIDIKDSKPTMNNESRTLDVMLGQSTVVDMQNYVFDYDGEPVRISKIDIGGFDSYIKATYNTGDSSFKIDVKQKFIDVTKQSNGDKNPHFNIEIKVYFTDSIGEEIADACEFTFVYKNNAPTFVSTDKLDPLYHYSVSGTELKIVYQEKDKCQAGMTIAHNLSSFIRDLDFPGSGSDSSGQAVGEYLNIQIGNDDWKKAYTLREFDNFIVNKIAEDSAVFAETSVSFKLRDSSNTYPIYKGGDIINIKIVVVTANTDPMSTLNREKEIADVVRGSHNTISPSGSARYPIATDKNANDRLRFLVAKDEITGEVDPIIEAKYADAEEKQLLYKVEHVQVNGVYDGSGIKITVSDDYAEDKINLANIITITDSYGGTLPLNGLVINVTLPPEKALINGNDKVLTDTTINGLVGYKGIPMKFTTDYSMGTQGGTAEFEGDMMLVDLNKLFDNKYVDKITLSSIVEGTGYVVNDKDKTVTINEDYQDSTIAIKAYFSTGGQAPTLMTINCAVADAKAYTFGMIGVLDEKKDKVDSNKVITINSLITDPHGGEFIFSSVSSSNPDLCTVTYQNNGTELVLIPHKAGVVAITIVVVDKNNPNRFMEKTLEVVLNGYPVVSVFDMIFGNVWYVIAIALGIVIVLTVIIVIIVKARKKKKLMKELETMLLAEMDAEEQLKLSGGNDMLMLGNGMMPNNMLLGAGQMQNNPMMYLNAGQGSQMMGQGYGQSQMYDPNQFGGQSQMMGQPGYGQSQMYDPNQFAGQSQMMNQGYGSQMMNQGYGNSQMYDPNQFGGQSQMNNQGYGQQPQQGYGQQQGGTPGGDGFFDLNDYNNFNR